MLRSFYIDLVKFLTPTFLSLFNVLANGLAVFMNDLDKTEVPETELYFLGVKLNFAAIFFARAAAGYRLP